MTLIYTIIAILIGLFVIAAIVLYSYSISRGLNESKTELAFRTLTTSALIILIFYLIESLKNLDDLYIESYGLVWRNIHLLLIIAAVVSIITSIYNSTTRLKDEHDRADKAEYIIYLLANGKSYNDIYNYLSSGGPYVDKHSELTRKANEWNSKNGFHKLNMKTRGENIAMKKKNLKKTNIK